MVSKRIRNNLAIAVGTALAGVSVAGADASPFTMKSLSTGYMLADAGDTKDMEGKCGEGKCGEGRCGGADMGAHVHADGVEGKCGEGKCGEGSCGGADMGAHVHSGDMSDEG